MISKIFRILLIGIVSLLLLFCILFATLQTKWARDMVRDKITSDFKERGISVYISDLSGQPPFSWSIEEVDLTFSDASALQLSHVKLRVAILPLLKGKLVVNYLKVENGTYSFTSTENPAATHLSLDDLKSLFKEQVADAPLPFPIAISYLSFSHLTIEDRNTQKTFAFGLTGAASVRQDKSEFDLDLQFLSPDQSQTYLELILRGNQRKNFIFTKLKWNLELPTFLAPYIAGQTVGDVDLKGPWTSWAGILRDQPFTTSSLIGEAKGIVDDTTVTGHPVLDRKWKFIALLSIPSTEEIDVRQFALTSDLMTWKGKARVFHDLARSQTAFTVAMPDLSLFSPLASGSAEGKLLYQDGAFKGSLETH
ncbi:MAG: hypothetical protein HYX67_16905, partial [Candidatus Melainabacteria bacterium]|nr:hypothetical protein [Candidatus Melainabacteria bacterium]